MAITAQTVLNNTAAKAMTQPIKVTAPSVANLNQPPIQPMVNPSVQSTGINYSRVGAVINRASPEGLNPEAASAWYAAHPNKPSSPSLNIDNRSALEQGLDQYVQSKGGSTAIPGTPGTLPSQLPTEANAMTSVDSTNMLAKDRASNAGIDPNLVPGTISAENARTLAQNATNMGYAQTQAGYAQTAADLQLNKYLQGAQSNISGFAAQMAQGQEGVTSAQAPQAIANFTTTTQNDIASARAEYNLQKSQRDQALQNLKYAQDSGQIDLAKQYSAEVSAREAQMQQAQNTALDIQTKSATAFAAIAQSQANTQKIQIGNLQDTFAGLGEKVVNLTPSDLVSMANSSGLPYNLVSNLQAQAVLTNSLTKAKTQGDIDKTLADISKLKAEAKTAGMSNNQIDYNYFKSLQPEDQDKFLQYLASKNPLQTITDTTTGNIYGVNPTTKQLNLVVDPSQINDALPSTSSARTIDIGNVGTGSPLPLGTLGDPNKIMRTDRHNNPIADNAYPVALARLSANGLVQGVDFQVGETDNRGNTTIMYKDPATGVRGSIVGLKSGDIASWYGNPSKYEGAMGVINELSQLSGQNVTARNAQEVFNGLDTAKQTDLVKYIYQNTEGGKVLFPDDTASNYDRYGLLSNVQGFNPSSQLDKNATNYLDSYFKSTNGALPTASSLFGSSRGANANKFVMAQDRAKDLYYAATGQNIPDLAYIKNSKDLINTNNKILNNLTMQEGTVGANFKLAIDNMGENGINDNSQPINAFIDTAKNLWGSPEMAQYLTQNSTLQNEVGNLLALKNASGTTVTDKLSSAGLIPKNASLDQQKSILNILLKEAENGADAIKGVNDTLYKQIDPLEQDPRNPNRQLQLSSRNDFESPTSNSPSATNQVLDYIGSGFGGSKTTPHPQDPIGILGIPSTDPLGLFKQ